MDHSAKRDDSGEKELNAFVQSLLKQMQDRFEEMSSSIVNRIDEMGTRIDDLEKSLGDLMKDIEGTGDELNPSSPSKYSGNK
mmetsp:Transcript_40502/g.35942  ORF Transcript_40502/g.35942 Transcript_40502/m.35942 type:complete len:82 (+) Transcript_40502:55-300(+)|eukprot:CAMPEP_0114589308 /NCGR_PEP_ID=MMETSP0125-20121206/11781_1 /TAXON_ID=485358 ORGANISM="Aristerostoma sp., Strain ATCC 50986" /NCGR_SAMPLE_ID=MMETSP0125 /ASSEMBLY_ACC=CAM_ASM_000245 /LENGTH=81 /DNA_ID=CAMNT_0001786115 /DNA_START=33 /DNA_END=278 /DNA_ORIENTATION=+